MRKPVITSSMMKSVPFAAHASLAARRYEAASGCVPQCAPVGSTITAATSRRASVSRSAATSPEGSTVSES